MDASMPLNFMTLHVLLARATSGVIVLVLGILITLAGTPSQAQNCVISGSATNTLATGALILLSPTNFPTTTLGGAFSVSVTPQITAGQVVVCTSYTNQVAIPSTGGPLPAWANLLFAFLLGTSGMWMIKRRQQNTGRFLCWLMVFCLSPNLQAQNCPPVYTTSTVSPVLLSTFWTVNGPGNFSTNGTGTNANFISANAGNGKITYITTWQASDGSTNFTTMVVPFSVAPVTAAGSLVASNDNAQTVAGQSVTIPVLANDQSSAGPLRIVSVTQGMYGTVTTNSDQTVTYTPGLAFPAGQFYASSINSTGLVCGYLALTNGITHAALWQIGGGITDLDPNGTRSIAETVNDSGSVVGYRTVGGGIEHAFVYANGQMVDLHGQVSMTGFPHSCAFGINNNGQICGQISSSADFDSPYLVGTNQAFFLGTNGIATRLTSFGGSSIAAFCINDSGLVVGASQINSANDDMHAFKWLLGDPQPTDLNTNFTIPNQWAMSVNAQGDIAGFSALYYNGWAFTIQTNVFYDLSEGYSWSGANAINSQGQIVGYWDGPQTGYNARALFWQGSHYFDLNTLLPTNSGWVLNQAININQYGQIVGTGTYQGTPCTFMMPAPTGTNQIATNIISSLNSAGSDTFTYTVTDGISTASAIVYVTMTPPNWYVAPWQAADPNNSGTGILTVFIDDPSNGAALQ